MEANHTRLEATFPRNIIKIVTWLAFLKAQETDSKFAKSVLRMVFKSLGTFLNHLNFPTLMRCMVK